jgi:acid phosphatase type 7
MIFQSSAHTKTLMAFFLILMTNCTFLQAHYTIGLEDPISVYLTWQRSPETTMTIQWVTDSHQSADFIEYKKEDETNWKTAKGFHFPLEGIYPFFVHRLELTNLQSGASYQFKIDSEDQIYKFRTMPANLASPVKFIAGGDMYHEETVKELMKTNLQAAQQDPMFVLVGGDIAYAGDKLALFPDTLQSWMDWFLEGFSKKQKKRKRWIEWLITWKKTMVTSDGYLIPIVPTIGNHDVNGRFGQTPDEAKIFYQLFPFPGKRGCNVLDFGKYMTIIILDSGHSHPIPGDQTNWLYQTLYERSSFPKKFALYHVPAFPSVRSFEGKYSTLIRKYWVPIFEQFDLTAAFENHDHAYKRTHPLKEGTINPTGALYIGDGAWGVLNLRKTKHPSKAWYLAKTASVRHFILVTVQKDSVRFTAISDNGEIIDDYTKE